jgi:manganese transport protein
VISAAFIGPGTVTTAASAGTGFGYSLLWALLFSTAACYVLQEASARITAVSGKNLGEAMRLQYGSSAGGRSVLWLALIAIVTGCAAFEAGNILGAAAGVSLISDQISPPLVVGVIGAVSGVLLWKGTIRQIAIILGLIVALMGFCFVITAFSIPHSFSSVFSGFRPGIPPGSELLVLGLIGTTVVPYNIFLGSGLRHSQSPSEMKTGLFIAIFLGGFISATVLLTGTAIAGEFSFEGLATTLSEHLGAWGQLLLGIGLFGAGLSSTLTAALAAAITARSILGNGSDDARWSETGIRFRSVWIGVLAIGLIFGFMQLRPVPIIILAQALNGVILPVIAVILFLMMNHTEVLPAGHRNGKAYNLLMGIVVYLTVLIGLTNLLRAFGSLPEFEVPNQNFILIASLILFAVIILPVIKNIFGRNP